MRRWLQYLGFVQRSSQSLQKASPVEPWVETHGSRECSVPRQQLRPAMAYQSLEPLWQRLPSRDAAGRRLSDFMMLIPGLRKQPDHVIRQRLATIEAVLSGYGEQVVFVEVNLRLNTLWVSVQARPGLCLEIPAAIVEAVPEARLVGQQMGKNQV